MSGSSECNGPKISNLYSKILCVFSNGGLWNEQFHGNPPFGWRLNTVKVSFQPSSWAWLAFSFSCESGVEQMTKPCYRHSFGAGAFTVTCSTQENSFLCEHSCFYERRKVMDMGFLPILSITALSFHSFAQTLCLKGPSLPRRKFKACVIPANGQKQQQFIIRPQSDCRTYNCMHPSGFRGFDSGDRCLIPVAEQQSVFDS